MSSIVAPHTLLDVVIAGTIIARSVPSVTITAETVLIQATHLLVVAVVAEAKVSFTFALTSQYPFVKAILVMFAAVFVVRETAEPLAILLVIISPI